MNASDRHASILPLPIGVGAQLVVSFAAAGFVALTLADGNGAALAITAAVITGMVLTFSLQRSLWLLDAALRGAALPMRGHGVLSPLVERVRLMLAQEADVSSLQKNLVRGVQDTAAQQERNRLARDLHDSIKQQIFSIQMSTAAAQARWKNDPDSAMNALDDVRRSAHEAMVEMNALLQQLAPAPLEKVGLVQALRDQCEALGYRAGVEVVVDIGELPDDGLLPQGTQESVFRMAQEALSNIARHARARNVRVHLGQDGAALVLDISDDGQGFDVNQADKGMGLTNLRQRVSELGGKLYLTSEPGNGTRLHAAIPFVEIAEAQEDIVTISNPTLNRVCLAGMGGGLLLMAALYYPLYVLLPGNYLADWQQGSALLGIILQAAAALVAVGIGYTAARWIKTSTRRDAMIFGALAGAIASVIAFAGLVGAAAGVVGSAALVQHGVTPALNENDMLQILDQVVIGAMWWTYGSFWGLLLAGIGLSALGGLLAASGDGQTEWKAIRFLAVGPLKIATIFSALTFLITYAFYGLLEPATQRGIDQTGLAMPWQYVNGITLLPLGTSLAIFVAMLAGLYYTMRGESRGEYARRLLRQPIGVILPYVLLTWVLFLFALNALSAELNFSTKVVLVGGTLMGLILAGGFINMAWKTRQEMIAEGMLQPLTRWQLAAFGGYALSIAMLFAGEFTALGLSILVAAVMIADREARKAPLDVRQLVNDMRQAVKSRRFIPNLNTWGWFVLIIGFTMTVLLLVSGWIVPGVILAIALVFYVYGAEKDVPRVRPVVMQSPINSLLATIMGISLPVLVEVPMALSLTLIAVPSIVTLASYDPSRPLEPNQPTMTELLQAHYPTHLQYLLLVFVAATVLVGLGMLIRWGVLRWSARRAVQIEAAV